jgi:glycosyltransferase involved in cell wall biosynthesis
MSNLPKITAIMCTYGRFNCVERAMNCFLAQTYPNKELIIYNTDIESPYQKELFYVALEIVDIEKYNIKVINNNIDKLTNQEYTNVGAIRRDALMFANGDYVVTWDDDDIFLPHFMQQAIDRMNETKLPSFKPAMSFFYSGNNLRLVQNTLEASIVASIDKVREYGYLLETGKEGLAWYTKMRDNKELDEHDNIYVPSYCFNWNDGDIMEAPHKQSGDIDNPENFNNHKAQSLDRVNDRSLSIYSEEKLRETYKPYYNYIRANVEDFPLDLVSKYVPIEVFRVENLVY